MLEHLSGKVRLRPAKRIFFSSSSRCSIYSNGDIGDANTHHHHQLMSQPGCEVACYAVRFWPMAQLRNNDQTVVERVFILTFICNQIPTAHFWETIHLIGCFEWYYCASDCCPTELAVPSVGPTMAIEFYFLFGLLQVIMDPVWNWVPLSNHGCSPVFTRSGIWHIWWTFT